MKKITILLILILSLNLIASQARIDSLRLSLKGMPNDTNKLHVLDKISYLFYMVQPDSGIFYAKKCQDLAQKLNHTRSIIGSYNLLGLNYWKKQEYDTAENFYLKAIELNKDFGEERVNGVAYTNLSSIAGDRGNYEKSLDYSEKAIKIAKKIGDKNIWAINLSKIGNVYYYQQDYTKAEEYYLKVIDMKKELDDKRGIGINYSKLGSIFLKIRDYEKSEKYYKMALKIYEEIGLTDGIASATGNLAILYSRDEATYALSKENYEKALEYSKKIGSKSKIARNYGNLGNLIRKIAHSKYSNYEFAKKVKDLRLGESYVKKAVEIFREIGDKRSEYKYLFILSYFDNDLGNIELGAMHFDMGDAIRDSIINDETQLKIADLDSKLENAELKSSILQMELKEKQNWTYFSFGLGTLFLVSGIAFVSLVISKNRRRREQIIAENERNKIELEAVNNKLQTLRLQMTPHFIFNSMNSIQSLILKNEDKNAVYYLNSFAKLMREVMENAVRNSVPLDEEAEFLKNYMEIEKLRFGGIFEYSIHIDEAIKPDETEIPPMLLQPFVENAIIHGVTPKGEGGKIVISVSKKNSELNIQIRDNGIGREKAIENSNKKEFQNNQHAVSINKQRINILKKISGKNIKLEIEDLKDEEGNAEGTAVNLTLGEQINE